MTTRLALAQTSPASTSRPTWPFCGALVPALRAVVPHARVDAWLRGRGGRKGYWRQYGSVPTMMREAQLTVRRHRPVAEMWKPNWARTRADRRSGPRPQAV